jgi:hypothetical protein
LASAQINGAAVGRLLQTVADIPGYFHPVVVG